MANLQSENFNSGGGGLRYYLAQYWYDSGDPRCIGLPLMREGPWPTLIVVGLYLLFVTRIGPALMKNRQPYQLRLPMLAYNTFMVVVNFYFIFKSLSWLKYGKELFNMSYPTYFDSSSHSAEIKEQIWSFYLYWLTKFVDLFDTVFFVLRKKDSQISVLHVYHHSVVPILGWLYMWNVFGAPAISLFALLNSTVHVIMYSYYALSAFGPRIRPYLWWKKYITQIQLLQFVILILYGVIVYFNSNYPSGPFWVATTQPPIFFCFFANFYVQAYFNKASKCQ